MFDQISKLSIYLNIKYKLRRIVNFIFVSEQLTRLLAYFIYSESLYKVTERGRRERCGVNFRPVGELGAPEATAFTTQ